MLAARSLRSARGANLAPVLQFQHSTLQSKKNGKKAPISVIQTTLLRMTLFQLLRVSPTLALQLPLHRHVAEEE